VKEKDRERKREGGRPTLCELRSAQRRDGPPDMAFVVVFVAVLHCSSRSSRIRSSSTVLVGGCGDGGRR